MHRENCPISEIFLLNEVSPKFESLRKINGSKYNGNIYKVLKSTLSSSGIFFKTVDLKYYFKEKEALDYIIKITEKVITKKIEKENKFIKNSNNKSNKKKKYLLNLYLRNQSFSSQMNYKICKVYNILDKMLSRCREKIDEKLNNSFPKINTSIELLQKIGGQNKIIGILMGFKYFKLIINNYFKLSSKKKKIDSLIDFNKLNDKLDSLSNKMEILEKNLPSTWNSSTASIKSNWLSETNYAVQSESIIDL